MWRSKVKNVPFNHFQPRDTKKYSTLLYIISSHHTFILLSLLS